MFGLFKSKDTRKKEDDVHKVGEALFNQVSVAKKSTANSSEFNERINSMYSAGYMKGFVNEKLSVLFENEKMKRKYTKVIFQNIFPSSGTKLIDSKLEAYSLGNSLLSEGDISKNVDVMLKTQEFEIGLLAGGHELCRWEEKEGYVPHMLSDYVTTGEIGELD